MKRKVFNLTDMVLSYRGMDIPANGGSVDMEIDFVPDRDLNLVEKGKIAFDALPSDWAPKVEVEEAPESKQLSLNFSDTVKVADEVEVKPTKRK